MRPFMLKLGCGGPFRPHADRLVTTTQEVRCLGRFQALERVGAGGFGEVWRAVAPGGLLIALKFLAVDEVSSERELRSLQMLQKVRDGHLLALSGVWSIPGYHVLAMELADGTLMDRLKQCLAEKRSRLPT